MGNVVRVATRRLEHVGSRCAGLARAGQSGDAGQSADAGLGGTRIVLPWLGGTGGRASICTHGRVALTSVRIPLATAYLRTQRHVETIAGRSALRRAPAHVKAASCHVLSRSTAGRQAISVPVVACAPCVRNIDARLAGPTIILVADVRLDKVASATFAAHVPSGKVTVVIRATPGAKKVGRAVIVIRIAGAICCAGAGLVWVGGAQAQRWARWGRVTATLAAHVDGSKVTVIIPAAPVRTGVARAAIANSIGGAICCAVAGLRADPVHRGKDALQCLPCRWKDLNDRWRESTIQPFVWWQFDRVAQRSQGSGIVGHDARCK